MNVTVLKPEADTLIADLEHVIARLRNGEQKATTCIVVLRDRVGETCGSTICGEAVSMSHFLGMLEFAKFKRWEDVD